MTKTIYLLIVFALPLSLLPFSWSHIIAGIVLVQGLISILFILPLIGTHFSSDAVFPEMSEGKLRHSYVTHQILTCVDWRPSSRFANEAIGGLNSHTAHHLFPQVSHSHYRWISNEIGEFCRENGLQHNVIGLRRAIRNHYDFLRRLSLN